MTSKTLHGLGRIGRLAGIFVPAAAAVLVGFQLRSAAQPAAGAAQRTGVTPGATTEGLIGLGLKFHGAADCANAKCHGAAQPAANGPPYYDEYTAFASGKNGEEPDPHSIAHQSLGGESEKGKLGAAMWTKYKQLVPNAPGTSATTSEKCLTCHALAAPKALQGPNFNIEEGVTCGSCHGPYQKWGDPHTKKVGTEWWTEAERKATKTPAAFLAKWGLYDTKNTLARADKCTSCHLAIDPKMVEAGHPQPQFEMYYYSAALYPSRHWRQEDGFNAAKLWAVGQAVSVRDAMQQLAERASNPQATDATLRQAYDQAMSHYLVFNALFTSKAVPAPANADPKNLDQWGAALQSAMAANKRPDVAKAATNLVSWTNALTPAVTAHAPSKASIAAILRTVAAQDKTVATYKDIGAEQQRGAVYALWTAYATSDPKVPEAQANPVYDQIDKLYPPKGSKNVDPAAYSAALNAIKGQLPK